MNLNQLAAEISRKEGGKQPQSIAQIKETLRCLGDVLRGQSLTVALGIVGKLITKRKK
tara:strand:- start:354 stop:527 length:174 start_codon:yes stop_codon:yes gene_type:complete